MSQNNINKKIKEHLQLVEDFLKVDAYDVALRILNEMLEFAPLEAEIYKNFGWIAFKQQKLDEAEKHFKKALSLDNNNSEYHYNLGWIYFYQSKLDLAEQHYEKTIELAPLYPVPYINLGAIKYENKNYNEALAYYQKAEALSPEDTHLLNNLADTYNKLKDYENAIKTYTKIIKIDPNNARAYGNLAVTYNESGNFPKAEELCKKALDINPESVNGHYNLASFYLQQGRLEEALKEINLAKKVSKHINRFTIELSIKIKEKLGIDHLEDSDLLDKLLNEDPLISQIRNKNHYKVIDILLERLENNILDFFSLSQLGYTLSQVGRYTEAISIFESAIKINPDDAWANQHYAFALSQSNKKQEAVKYYKIAIELDPESIWARKQLAETLIQLNDFDSASIVVQSAITLSEVLKQTEFIGDLISLKASLIEKYSLDEAIDWYMLAAKYSPDESYNYERLSALLAFRYADTISAIKLPEQLAVITKNDIDSILLAAINNYRKGNLDTAIKLYKDLLDINIEFFPAYAGISQALYEKRYGTIDLEIKSFNDASLKKLIPDWNSLSELEQYIIYLSITPLEEYIEKISELKGKIEIVPIDTKLTSLPENDFLKDELYIDGTPYDGIRALGGINVFIGVERLRDILWIVPSWLKQVPASLAHEFAHQVYETLSENQQLEIETIYQESVRKSLPLVSEYSAVNSQEFFAENYAMYTRNIIHKIPTSNNSKIIAFLEKLIYND